MNECTARITARSDDGPEGYQQALHFFVRLTYYLYSQLYIIH